VQSTSRRPLICLAIPACDRISGLSNRLTILIQGLCFMLTKLSHSWGLQKRMQGFLFMKHTYVGGHTLVGRFSGIWTQSGIVLAFKSVTVYTHFGEAAVPEGECQPCPDFASIYTPAFTLQLRKNHGKTSVGVAEKRLTEYCWAQFVSSTWRPFHGRPRPACWPSLPLSCASGG
jgi:hypothetical protein